MAIAIWVLFRGRRAGSISGAVLQTGRPGSSSVTRGGASGRNGPDRRSRPGRGLRPAGGEPPRRSPAFPPACQNTRGPGSGAPSRARAISPASAFRGVDRVDEDPPSVRASSRAALVGGVGRTARSRHRADRRPRTTAAEGTATPASCAPARRGWPRSSGADRRTGGRDGDPRPTAPPRRPPRAQARRAARHGSRRSPRAGRPSAPSPIPTSSSWARKLEGRPGPGRTPPIGPVPPTPDHVTDAHRPP